MEDRQFDELTRRMGAAVSRRQALKVVLTATIGGIFFRSGRAEASSVTNSCGTFCNQLPPGPQRGNCLFQAIHRQGPCYDCGPRGSNKGLCGGECCKADKPQCLKGTCCALEGQGCAQSGDCCFGVCASSDVGRPFDQPAHFCCGTGNVCDAGPPSLPKCCAPGDSCCTGTNAVGVISNCCPQDAGCKNGNCCQMLGGFCRHDNDCCDLLTRGAIPCINNKCCLTAGRVCTDSQECCGFNCEVNGFGIPVCCVPSGQPCPGLTNNCCGTCIQRGPASGGVCCTNDGSVCNQDFECCSLHCGPKKECCVLLGERCYSDNHNCCQGNCGGTSGETRCCLPGGSTCQNNADCCTGSCVGSVCTCEFVCLTPQGGTCVLCGDANMCCSNNVCVQTCPLGACCDGDCCHSDKPDCCILGCTSTQSDPNNCGTCRNQCQPGHTCQHGQCTSSNLRTCPQGVPGSSGPHFHDCDDSGSDGPCLCMTTNDGKNVCVANGGCNRCFSDCSKCASGTVCIPDVNCQNPNICGGGLSVFCGSPC